MRFERDRRIELRAQLRNAKGALDRGCDLGRVLFAVDFVTAEVRAIGGTNVIWDKAIPVELPDCFSASSRRT